MQSLNWLTVFRPRLRARYGFTTHTAQYALGIREISPRTKVLLLLLQ